MIWFYPEQIYRGLPRELSAISMSAQLEGLIKIPLKSGNKMQILTIKKSFLFTFVNFVFTLITYHNLLKYA